jgi:hypothetical protein
VTFPSKDSRRANAAARAILDGRDPQASMAEIMVTLEHTIAAMLIVTQGDPKSAALMLNEGVLEGVETRLALYGARKAGAR